MSRIRKYVPGRNVLDEAHARMDHVLDLFDSVVVAFSGGKDSLAALHVVHEAYQRHGITKPVEVVFRDEELIADPILDFVNEYRQLPWVNMRWFAVPLASAKYVLNSTREYVQWDPNREHLRPAPDWAITLDDLGLPPDTVMDQYSMDEVTADPLPGKVCIITGMRAAEGHMRFRSAVTKLNDNYLTASTSPRVQLGKPLFDWEENDVFRYFYDQGIRYCPIYDAQVLSGAGLRVSSPLHAESAKRIGDLRSWAPVFYDQVLALEPDMAITERYYGQLNTGSLVEQYGGSLDGVAEWIEATLTEPKQKAKAIAELRRVRVAQRNMPDLFPSSYVLKAFMAGHYKRTIPPQRTQAERTRSRQENDLATAERLAAFHGTTKGPTA